jgi:acyl-CoA synthetase (AMP-forming)/AMP-acid ligase II
MRLFALVDETRDDTVFAWGMEIASPEETEAVIYRKDPVTKRLAFGVHEDAAAALRLYGRVHELRLVWDEDCEAYDDGED